MITYADSDAVTHRGAAIVAALRQRSANAAAIALSAVLTLSAAGSAVAQSSDDAFTTAATGLVQLGASSPR